MYKIDNKIYCFFFAIAILLGSIGFSASAQQVNVNQIDFKSIRVDELSDAQVKQFVNRAESTGMTMQELESQAISRGMPYSEVLKLRQRIKDLDMEKDASGDATRRERSSLDKIDFEEFYEEEEEEDADSIAIFGSELFKRQRHELTFEPSLSIPTPANYELGSGDVLNIEVWGASQSSLNLEITPEGQIMVPNIGPIRVGGLTIEKASRYIINKLSSIYSGLKGANPNTFAQVSLGDIRSIKVTVAGDVFMPGTYTLPAFATVFNALYYAGGPDKQGTYRDIRVVRAGKVVANVDLYDFLLRGETSHNIRLKDEDMVFISTYKNRLTLLGEVVRPAIYELKDNETLADAIEFAGGFSTEAYSKNLVVNRKTDKERKLLNVDSDLFSSFLMHNGDLIEVGKVLDRFENRVHITGAVFREGEYGLIDGMTLTDLIQRAEGLREDAFMERAAIYRLQDDLQLEMIPINLNRVTEEESEDYLLQREDSVVISSILDLSQIKTITVAGEVQNPGEYAYAKNIALGEAIRIAGGLNDAASLARVEVARRVRDQTSEQVDGSISDVFSFPLDRSLSLSDKASSFKLEPFDLVFVRRSPGYQEQILVEIEGEVSFPGSYALINKNERISDVIRRAGGLTNEAYVKGATVLRHDNRLEEERQKQLESMESYDMEFQFDSLEQHNRPIGINLEKILSNPGNQNDLFLVDGDVIKIPKELQTVRLSGALLNPTITRHQKSMTVRGYVSQAGGFAENARKRKVFVVYPNGSVDRTRNYVLFRSYPKVTPGAEIIVPEKPEKEPRTLRETLAIGSAMSSIALVIVSIIGQL